MLIDTMEIVNSIDESKQRKRPRTLMPLLFDPEFTGRVHDPVSGTSRQTFKLKNLDLLGIRYSVEPLPFGDYIIPVINDGVPSVVIIERKTMADLISSFASAPATGTRDGKIRLDKEIEKCIDGKEQYDDATVELLVEDFYECRLDFSDEGRGVWIPTWQKYSTKEENLDREKRPYYMTAGYTRRAIHPGALLAKLEAIKKKGVDVVLRGGALDAYKYVIDMVQPVPDRDYIRPTRQKPKYDSIDDERAFILQGFSGIGGAIAGRIVQKFGSLIDAFNAIVASPDAASIGIKGLHDKAFTHAKDVLSRGKDALQQSRE